LILATALLAAVVGFSAEQPPEQDEKGLVSILLDLPAISWDADPPKDPLIRGARALRAYQLGEIDEPTMAKELRAAYPDRQVRDSLVQTKTQLIDLLGSEQAQHYLGTIHYLDPGDSGKPTGSDLEDRYHAWRDNALKEMENGTAADFRGQNVINGEKHTVFFANVGSEPKGEGQVAATSDVDINVMSSDLELARQMAESMEARFREKYGISPVEVDIVVTTMGLSGPEVYVGEAGRAMAGRLIAEGRCGTVRRVDLDAGALAETWTGPDALMAIRFEAGLRESAVASVEGLRLPDTGPAAILEMARHIDRDVLRGMQFEDFDTLFKIAKLVERADLAAGERGVSLDSDLVRFSKELLEIKTSKDWPRGVELVRSYFKELPAEMEFGRTRGPKTAANITFNHTLLKEFGESCRDQLMAAGKDAVRAEIKSLKDRQRLSMDGFEDGNALLKHVLRLKADLELEDLVLQDPTHGLQTMDPELRPLIDEFTRNHNDFLKDNWKDLLPEEYKQQIEFAKKNLEQGGDTNRELAAAALVTSNPSALELGLNAAEQLGTMLDCLGDTLLGPLDGDTDWREVLVKSRAAAVSEHSKQVFGWSPIPDSVSAYTERANRQIQRAENHLNALFYDNFLAKRIQDTNRVLNQAIASSSVVSAGMDIKGKIDLVEELAGYWEALDKDGWEGLAVEFFQNRVPGSGAVENVVMGNYGLATWDVFTTLIPAAAMSQTAFNLGEAMGHGAWQLYWSAELEEFLDELYDDSIWEVGRPHNLGRNIELKELRLVSVTYRGHEIRIDEYVAEKKRQIEEMRSAVQSAKRTKRSRQTGFPYEYVSQDPLTGWLKADGILRENLAHTDNVLLILDEAKNHPLSGWRMDDLIHKQWTTRWEEVKLRFLLEAIKELEKKEQAREFGPERFNDALEQLHEITDELRITEQVDAGLTSEGVEPTITSYLRWLRNLTPDSVAATFEVPAAEEAWVEATRIVLDALEVYDTVLKARTTAEASFVRDGRSPEDNGLRFLSTPFLLSGKPATDRTGHQEWTPKPAEVITVATGELAPVKEELTGSGLDTADDSFDQRIIRGVVYHDVFKLLWRHVQTTAAVIHGGVSNLDFEVWWELAKQVELGQSEELSAMADRARESLAGGPGDLPLERIRDHDAARDQLVADFVEHYLLDRLNELVNRAVPLSEQISAWCAEAADAAANVETTDETLRARADEIHRTLDAIEPRLDEAPTLLADITDRHEATETATAAVGDAAAAVERLADEICSALDRLRSESDPQQQRALFDRMEALAADLAVEVDIGSTGIDDAREATEAAATAVNHVETLLEEIDQVVESTADIEGSDDGSGGLTAARALIEKARTSLTELLEVRNEALDLGNTAVEVTRQLGETDSLTDLLRRAENGIDRAAVAYQAVDGCPDEAEAAVVTAEPQLAEAVRLLGAARQRVESLETRAATVETGLETAAQKAEAADFLVTMAERYAERIQLYTEAAQTCRELATRLVPGIDRPPVPDVIGLPAADATAAVEQAGLSAAVVAADSAPDPELAFTVFEQAPAGGGLAPAGGVVTLRVYGESTVVTVPTVIGLAAAEAQAALEGVELHAALVAGESAPTPEQAYLVQHQSPDPGSRVKRGAAVTLRILGDFDTDAALRGVDCSTWPGTRAVWDTDAGGPKCACPDAARWDGAAQRCVSAPPPVRSDDRCTQLGEAFQGLMLANQVDEAWSILEQGRDCAFYGSGLAALQERHARECLGIDNQILDACLRRDVSRAKGLVQQAAAQQCSVSPQAYSCIDQARQAEESERKKEKIQAWTNLFTAMNDAVHHQQQAKRSSRPDAADALRPNLASNDTPLPKQDGPFDPLNVGGHQDPAPVTPPPGDQGGSSGGGQGSSGGGASAEECDRKYCSMCHNDIDLIGESVDSQCMDCRRVNAANIRACQEGRQAGPEVETTATYRVACSYSSSGAVLGCSCYGPNQSISPESRVVLTTRSWDECQDTADRMNGR